MIEKMSQDVEERGAMYFFLVHTILIRIYFLQLFKNSK